MKEQFSRFDEEPLHRRGRVVSMALFYSAVTSLFLALFFLALYMIVTEDAGFLVMLFVGGIFGSLMSVGAVQYLRDLNARPIRVEGEVMRKWYKSNPMEIFVLLLLIVVGLGAFRVLTGNSIPLFATLLIGLVGFLAGSRLIVPLLADLAIALSEKERLGILGSLASLALSVFRPAFYILVDDKIYSVTRLEYSMLLEDDRVRITCYPHSLTIEQIERYDTTDKAFVPATSGSLS